MKLRGNSAAKVVPTSLFGLELGSAADISAMISIAESLVDRQRRLKRLLPIMTANRPLLIRNDDRNSFDEQSELLDVTDDEAAVLSLGAVKKAFIVRRYPDGMRRQDWTADTAYQLELQDAGANLEQGGSANYSLCEAGFQEGVVFRPNGQVATVQPQYAAIRDILWRKAGTAGY